MPNARQTKKSFLPLSAHRKKCKGGENLRRWREAKAMKNDDSLVAPSEKSPGTETSPNEICFCSTPKNKNANETASENVSPIMDLSEIPNDENLGTTSFSNRSNDSESDDSDWLAGIEPIPNEIAEPRCYEKKILNEDQGRFANNPVTISGRRIVDMSFFISKLQNIGKHEPFNCSFADMDICNERQIGMITEYTFVCKMCKKRETITTEDCSTSSDKLNLNTAMVSAMTSVGQNYSQLEEICCCLDMPCMSKQTYIRHKNLVDSAIHDCAWESMEEAAREEAEIAKAAGSVDSEGVPEITVIVDGAWCKRSYKTNYNALSGVGCIIGLKTKKVLYIGVRNSYCCICARAQGKKLPVPEHICYKNWSKTSTAMESDIIVEGFKKSKEMYNLKYVNVIGDGDSSVMSKLVETQPYGPATTISKIECTNHLLRNYVKKLREVGEQKRNEVGPVPGELRNKVKTNLLRLRYAVTGAVKFVKNKQVPVHEKVRELQEDISNGPLHVFGDHSKCKPYFCNGPKEGELNVVQDLKTYGLWNHIMAANSYLNFFSFSLLQCVTTNLAECFNAVVCKFVAGKRMNLSQRNSYTTRSEISALSMNEKEGTLRRLYKKMTLGISPGKHSKLISLRKQKKRLQPKKIEIKKSKRKAYLFPDRDYGETIEQSPDIDDDLFETRKTELLTSLKMDEVKIAELERNSRGQSLCDLWVRERKKRITASNFGRICKMRPTTPCQKMVEQLLYKDFAGNSATRYGLENEKNAVSELEELIGVKVEECGLFVDKTLQFLAASPDGIIDNKGLVEVKCPAVAKDLTPAEAVLQKKIKFCTLDEDCELKLKRNHSFFYQIQGQLHIANKNYCLFIVWTPKGLSVEKIVKDDQFWGKPYGTTFKGLLFQMHFARSGRSKVSSRTPNQGQILGTTN